MDEVTLLESRVSVGKDLLESHHFRLHILHGVHSRVCFFLEGAHDFDHCLTLRCIKLLFRFESQFLQFEILQPCNQPRKFRQAHANFFVLFACLLACLLSFFLFLFFSFCSFFNLPVFFLCIHMVHLSFTLLYFRICVSRPSFYQSRKVSPCGLYKIAFRPGAASASFLFPFSSRASRSLCTV